MVEYSKIELNNKIPNKNSYFPRKKLEIIFDLKEKTYKMKKKF